MLRNQFRASVIPGIENWPQRPLTNSELQPPATIAQVALGFALDQLGDAYVALPSGAMNTGLTTNDESWDCSGLTWRAYYEAGLPWPAMPSYSQMNSAFVQEVPVESAQPGDLVFYDYLNDPKVIPRGLTGRAGVDHVAMVLDPVAGTVVEAGNESVGVQVDNYLNPDGSPIAAFVSVGRVVAGNQLPPGAEATPPLVTKNRFQKLLSSARESAKSDDYLRVINFRRAGTDTITNPLTSPATPLQILKALPKAIQMNGWTVRMVTEPGVTRLILTNPKDKPWRAVLEFQHANWDMGTLSISVSHAETAHISRVLPVAPTSRWMHRVSPDLR